MGRTSIRVGYAGMKGRLGSGIDGETGLIVLVVGLKSKSCVGALKVPDVGPASAAKITWPFGRTAAGASSAPNGEEIPFNVPIMSGPAAQVFVEGLYSAVCWVAPITIMRSSCSRRTGPSS